MSTSKPKLRRGDLSRTQVVAVALACLDRGGLANFSLREVARDLGVFPTAIYWHVPGGRNGLLAHVAALVIDGVTPPLDPDVSWQAWLFDLFHRYRAAVRAHPNAAQLLGAQLVSNTGVQAELVEGIVWALERGGMAGETLLNAYNAVVAGMVGFVTLELARPPEDDLSEWEALQQARVATLADGDYPAIARNAQTLAGRAFILRWKDGIDSPMDQSFDTFARALIGGLATHAASLSE